MLILSKMQRNGGSMLTFNWYFRVIRDSQQYELRLDQINRLILDIWLMIILGIWSYFV